MVGVFAALVAKWVTTSAHAPQSTLRRLRKGGEKSQCGELVLAAIVEKKATTPEPVLVRISFVGTTRFLATHWVHWR